MAARIALLRDMLRKGLDTQGSLMSLRRIFAPRVPPAASRSWRPLAGTGLQIIVLALGVGLYCRAFLQFGTARGLPGAESEVFQTLDWTLAHSVREHLVFPLWNPYLDTGMPYVADPMLHAFNPLASLPVLIFGVHGGFRIALLLSFFTAAVGMWYLAGVLGMGWLVRLWCGFLFAFAGQPAARFIQGQYLFVLGFAWIPWSFAFLIQALRTRRRWYSAWAVVCLSLVFFSGNDYYGFYMLMAGLLLGAVFLVNLGRLRPYFQVEVGRAKVLLLIGLAALGLVAVQVLPLLEFLPRIAKSNEVHGSHTPYQVLLDYTSTDRARPDTFPQLPAPEEFYAYLGVGPFLALALLPLAWRRGDRRALTYFALLLALTLLWIGMLHLPWGEWLARTRLVGQFRHLLRILILGNVAIITLAGAGLDALLKILQPRVSPRSAVILSRAAIVALAAFLVYTLADVFSANSRLFELLPRYENGYTIARFIRANDPGEYFVYHDPQNAWQDAIVGQGLTFLDTWYHFDDIHQGRFGPSDHRVKARAHYLIQDKATPPPADPLAKPIFELDGAVVYRLPSSLPLAFLVPGSSLGDREHELTRAEVIPLTPYFPSANRAEVIAEAQAGQKLVILITSYPGWRVTVDGRPQPLEDISGYLTVNAVPGNHKYSFAFRPTSFYLGLTVSLCVLVLLAFWLITDRPWSRQQLATIRQSFVRDWRPVQARWNGIVAKGIHRLLPESTGSDVPGVEPPGAAPRKRFDLVRRALRRALGWAGRLENFLLLGALGVYLAVRLIRLADYPIWFFADEAIQTLLASDFVRDGLRDFHGYLFPTYFLNVYGYNENLTVYAQVIPYLLFGKTVFVTRAVSVVVTAFGALAVGLILRRIFRARMPWIGILLLSAAPAWFLHSRTAFETTHMASYYAWFLYCYLRYRTGSPRALYPALIFGAATFYTTGAGEIIIAGTGLMLLLLDARYHWSQRRTILRALPLALLLTLPYLRFRLQMGAEHTNLLRLFDSYWLRDLPLGEKLRTALGYYAYAISPGYWFLPNTHDGARHVMDGYGNLMLWTLPFTLAGLGMVLWRFRQPEYRTLIVPIVAIPLGAVVVDVGITRILPFVIPATLLAALAIEGLTAAVSRRVSAHAVALAAFTTLAGVNLFLLGDSLIHGPFWNLNYGMEIPWGGPQVFGAVEQWHEREPGAFFYVSPTWANGVDTLRRFFLPDDFPVDIANADRFTEKRQPLTDATVLVLTAREYEQALQNPKLTDVRVEQSIPYPDGSPGFYFVRVRYSDQADAIFEQERLERLKPITETLTLNGSVLTITHPLLDSGGVQHMFDGDPYTLARGYEANPMLLSIGFDKPRDLAGVDITTGSMQAGITVRVYPATGGDPAVFGGTYTDLPNDPTISIDFPNAPNPISRVELEIRHLMEPGPAKIHVREIHFR